MLLIGKANNLKMAWTMCCVRYIHNNNMTFIIGFYYFMSVL